MTSEEKIPLFSRKASGLVRELSTAKAFAYNLMTGCYGWNPSYAITFIGTYGASALILGWSLWTWMWLLAIPFLTLYGVCFVWLCSSIPRSGGDYIYSSRIMTPYLGWIESFGLVFGCWAVVGANIWETVNSVHGLAKVNALLFPGTAWEWWANLLNDPMNFFYIGLPFFAATVLLYFQPPRRLYSLITVLVAISVVVLPVFLLGVVGVTPESFAANFSKFTGQDVATLMANAQEGGFVVGQPSGFEGPSLFMLWVWILLLFLGYTWTTYMAGELKGNIARNVSLSILITIIANFLWTAVMPVIYMKAIGYDFAAAWGWMSFNAKDSLPLGNMALTHVIAIIARPDLWYVFTFGSIFFSILPPLLVSFLFGYMPTRVIFAWSMDRMAPAAMTKVGKRSGQPTYTIILTIFWGFLFFWWTVTGTSPLATLWFFTLAMAPTWIFPGLNCLLLPYRRPELYKRSAWKYNIGRAPVVAVVGLITLAVFGYVHVGAYAYPILKEILALKPEFVYTYAATTGIVAAIGLFIAGTVYYLLVRWIQRRRGVDMELIYKSVPPE